MKYFILIALLFAMVGCVSNKQPPPVESTTVLGGLLKNPSPPLPMAPRIEHEQFLLNIKHYHAFLHSYTDGYANKFGIDNPLAGCTSLYPVTIEPIPEIPRSLLTVTDDAAISLQLANYVSVLKKHARDMRQQLYEQNSKIAECRKK